MASVALQDIMQRSTALDNEEKLELIAHLANSVCVGEAPGHSQEGWEVAQGEVSIPSEDAKDCQGWPAGFFEQTYGGLADDPVERLPQGELELREAISCESSESPHHHWRDIEGAVPYPMLGEDAQEWVTRSR